MIPGSFCKKNVAIRVSIIKLLIACFECAAMISSKTRSPLCSMSLQSFYKLSDLLQHVLNHSIAILPKKVFENSIFLYQTQKLGQTCKWPSCMVKKKRAFSNIFRNLADTVLVFRNNIPNLSVLDTVHAQLYMEINKLGKHLELFIVQFIQVV